MGSLTVTMDVAIFLSLISLSIVIIVHIIKITSAFTQVKTQLDSVIKEVESLRVIKHSFAGLDQRTAAFARFIERVESDYEKLDKRVRELEMRSEKRDYRDRPDTRNR
jgi:biopolymer transport protein ExbB/TolQ